MANTITNINFANTFGEWVVATSQVITENNNLASGDYTKNSGTLYLNETTQNSLQANGNIIAQKELRVVGTGSSATIQNNLTVAGQVYFTNSTLGLTHTGQANLNGLVLVQGPNTALQVSNSASIGGNTTIRYNLISNSLQSNTVSNTQALSVTQTTHTNFLQANSNIVTGSLSANGTIYSDVVSANSQVVSPLLNATNIAQANTVQANNKVNTAIASVTQTTYTGSLQSNTTITTGTISANTTVHANVVQANVSVNTATLSATGTGFVSILQSNNSINTANISATGTGYVNVLQANSSINTATLSATGTGLVNVLQANSSVNTTTISATGTALVNVLQANTSVSTATLSASGTGFVNLLQANSSVNTATVTSININATNGTFANVIQGNVSVNTATLSVTGTSFSDVVRGNTSISTPTLSVSGTGFANVAQANISVNTATLSVTGSGLVNVLQANTRVNTATLYVTQLAVADALQSNTSLSVVGVTRSDTVVANTSATIPTLNLSTKLDGNNASGFLNSLQVQGALSVGGNFVISGSTIYTANTFRLSENAPSGISSYIQVNRGLSGANAALRWNEPQTYWDVLNVTSNTYYRILTNEHLNDTVTSTSTTTVATANSVNAVSINVSSSSAYANAAFLKANSAYGSQNTTGTYANSAYAAANTADSKAADAGSYANSAFIKANSAYQAANLSTNYIVGTTGTVSPSSGYISFTSNNGVTVVATSANNLAVSTSQDLRTTASPTFAGLSLTSPLSLAQGGTGATSASAALTALLPTGTTSGYVLTTGGPGNFYWAAGGGGGLGSVPGTAINSTRQSYTANGAVGYTGNSFNIPTATNATQVRAYIDGVRQFESEYSLNLGANTISFLTTPDSGNQILIEVDGYYVNPYYANNIAFTINNNISPTANTIQLAIDGLTSKVTTYYANLAASPVFTTVATGVTVAAGTSNTAFATTAYVQNLANSSGTLTTSITGNAGTVTNGVYTNGSYSNPAWITALDAAKISSGTLPNARLVSIPNSSLANTAVTINGQTVTLGGANFNVNSYIGIASSQVSGLASSATTDTTNASNISSGTLAAGRLPAFSGDITTSAGSSSTTLATVNSNVGTYGGAAVVPVHTVNAKGLITASANVNIAISSGAVSGLATSATTDTTNASNITSGTLAAARLATSGVTNGTYGGSTNIPVLGIDTYGRVTSAANVAVSIPGSSTDFQVNSLGVGTAGSGTAGEIRATNNITAYYSDDNLKDRLGNIQNALDKLMTLNGFYYQANKTAQDLGYAVKKEVGVSAQEVQRVLPEVVVPAPIDDRYLTVHYERIIPLLIEAIKELKNEVDSLKGNSK